MEERIRRFRITDKIEYVVPGKSADLLSCSGLIIDSSAKVLIDTNLGETHTRKLLESERPDFAIISHYHLDHSTWGALVPEHSRAKLLIPSEEEEYLTNHEYFVLNTAAPYGLDEEWTDFTLNHSKYREISQYDFYDQSTDLGLSDVKMVFIGTPGHSSGHTSINFPEQKIVFTGDLGLDRFGPWYGWPDCDLEMYVESLLRMKSLNPVLLLTSHEGIIRDNIEETFDLCLHAFFLREDMIKKKLDDGLSREDIIEQGIYFRNKEKVNEPMKTILGMWDSYMFDHHLKKLGEGGLRKDFPGLGF